MSTKNRIIWLWPWMYICLCVNTVLFNKTYASASRLHVKSVQELYIRFVLINISRNQFIQAHCCINLTLKASLMSCTVCLFLFKHEKFDSFFLNTVLYQWLQIAADLINKKSRNKQKKSSICHHRFCSNLKLTLGLKTPFIFKLLKLY